MIKMKSAFSFLEIMVVLFIISILVAVVAPKIIGRTDEARIVEAKLQIKNFETALKLFKLDNGKYPDTQEGLKSLIEKPASGEVYPHYREEGYLDKTQIPRDPWGNEYVYISPGIHGPYDIISYGADGLEGGENINADIVSWDIE